MDVRVALWLRCGGGEEGLDGGGADGGEAKGGHGWRIRRAAKEK